MYIHIYNLIITHFSRMKLYIYTYVYIQIHIYIYNYVYTHIQYKPKYESATVFPRLKRCGAFTIRPRLLSRTATLSTVLTLSCWFASFGLRFSGGGTQQTQHDGTKSSSLNIRIIFGWVYIYCLLNQNIQLLYTTEWMVNIQIIHSEWKYSYAIYCLLLNRT